MDPRGPSPAARAHAMMLSLPLRNMLDGIGERVATCFAVVDQEVDALNGIENNLHELRYANRNPAQAKANARAHYGLGTDLYRPWLDDALMMYTCGYDPDGRAPHLFDKCVLKR